MLMNFNNYKCINYWNKKIHVCCYPKKCFPFYINQKDRYFVNNQFRVNTFIENV